MLHEPANQDTGTDNAADYKTKIGILLFFIYAAVFAVFVLINTIAPEIMGIVIGKPFGLNVAMLYGFSLILFAIILGIVYNLLCTAKEKELNL